MMGCQRSLFFTDFLSLVRQPLATHFFHQSFSKQSERYLLSVTMTIGESTSRIAASAAISSMRLFVVSPTPPLPYLYPGMIHAQPPGPGLFKQAPSV